MMNTTATQHMVRRNKKPPVPRGNRGLCCSAVLLGVGRLGHGLNQIRSALLQLEILSSNAGILNEVIEEVSRLKHGSDKLVIVFGIAQLVQIGNVNLVLCFTNLSDPTMEFSKEINASLNRLDGQSLFFLALGFDTRLLLSCAALNQSSKRAALLDCFLGIQLEKRSD